MARRRILIALGVVLGLAGAGWLAWRATAPPGDGAYNQDDNAAWLRRHWIHGGEGAGDPARLAAELRALGITRIYPFLGPPDAEGWPGWRDGGQIRRYEPARAGAFFAAMQAAAPEIVVIPWTGGVLDRDMRRLEDASLRAAFAAHLGRLVALGADGVQLNVEPMPSDSPGYIELLRAVRAAIGPEAILSVAAYPPTTHLHPYPEVHWTLDFTQRVCREVDEVAVMAYDTGLGSVALYEGLMATWTRDLLLALPPPAEGGCEVRIGIPAYEDDVPWHRPDVETMAAGLRGVLRGLRRLEVVPPHFRGVAIYASWTTDEAEWAAYDALWRGRRVESGGRITEAP